MNLHNIQRLIDYGSTYRVQEMADMLADTAADELADDICAVILTFKGVMPPEVWRLTVGNLMKFQVNVQFQLIREAEEDDSEEMP